MYTESRRQLLAFSLFFCFFFNLAAPVQAQNSAFAGLRANTALKPNPCHLAIDGQKFDLSLPLCLSPRNESLISIQDVIRAFSCHLEYAPGGSLRFYHIDKNLVFEKGEYYCSYDLEKLAPLQQLEAVYVPLRSVAEGLDYTVVFNQESALISLESPAYIRERPDPLPSPPPQAAATIPPPPAGLPTWGSLNSDLSARWPEEQIIAGYYTTLINSPTGRTNNIDLSCSRIDGSIVQPGETFSFNRVVGERTEEAGYRDAKIFVGNKVSTGLGGGICQTSSTLYNAALEAGLDIVERYPHSLKVTYAPPQRDATVSWGGADFKFANNLEHPVRIRACIYGSYVMAAICQAP